MNILHSVILVLAMLGLLAVLGYSLLGRSGLFWTVAIGLFLTVAGQQISPQLIMRLYDARPIAVQEAPQLYRMSEELSLRAGLKKSPQLYYVPSKVPNAFAVGPNKNASIGLTDGLLRRLDLRELTGVLAHEISHIDHNDMWVMGFADIISRITHLFSSFGKLLLLVNLPLLLMGQSVIPWFGIFMLIVAPVLVDLLQLALSRTREFDADVGAVAITGDPDGLAGALYKMEMSQGHVLRQILTPGHSVPGPSIFRTHPHTKDRIKRLYQLADRDVPPLFLEDVTQRTLFPTGVVQVTQRPRWRYMSGLWY